MAINSSIWKLFTTGSENSDKSTCSKTYGSKGGTTSSLINHLRSCHQDEYEQYCDETKVKSNPAKKIHADFVATDPFLKQRKIEDCIPQSDVALDISLDKAIADRFVCLQL